MTRCSVCNKGAKGRCNNLYERLKKHRNSLITLTKLSEDKEKIKEYKELIEEIESLVKDLENCPDPVLVSQIKIYIDNEYLQYN